MTRKRYIKLLMACGQDRNGAEYWARHAREVMNRSYRADAEAWERVFRDMARVAATEWSRAFELIKADLLHRALYGEVAYE